MTETTSPKRVVLDGHLVPGVADQALAQKLEDLGLVVDDVERGVDEQAIVHQPVERGDVGSEKGDSALFLQRPDLLLPIGCCITKLRSSAHEPRLPSYIWCQGGITAGTMPESPEWSQPTVMPLGSCGEEIVTTRDSAKALTRRARRKTASVGMSRCPYQPPERA